MNVSNIALCISNRPAYYIDKWGDWQSKDEELKYKSNFILDIIANLQDCMDYEKTVEILIESGNFEGVIERLRFESDAGSMSIMDPGLAPI